MSNEFLVHPAELRSLASDCNDVQQSTARDVTADHLHPASELLAGSLVATAMQAADARIAVALADAANEVGIYSENVVAAAEGYESTDDANAQSLQVFDE